MIRAGVAGGLLGAVIIWIYEALIWVGAQHLMPLAGIPRNAEISPAFSFELRFPGARVASSRNRNCFLVARIAGRPHTSSAQIRPREHGDKS
jgi:hypothetical protein